MDIMTVLFDEEEVTRRYGLRMQRENTEKIAAKLIKDGNLSFDRIADCTGLSEAEVKQLAKLEFA